MDDVNLQNSTLKQQIEVATKAGTLDIDNPLLDHIWLPWARHSLQLQDASDSEGMDNFEYGEALRRFAIAEYSWAVPTSEALSTILSFGHNIVELGSGQGYWASLLAAAGGNVTVVDNGSVKHNDHQYFPQTVHRDGAAYLQEHGGAPDTTLFIRWGKDFDAALAAFRWQYLAVVGEKPGGCTWWPEGDLDDSDDDADQGQRQWRLIRTVC